MNTSENCTQISVILLSPTWTKFKIYQGLVTSSMTTWVWTRDSSFTMPAQSSQVENSPLSLNLPSTSLWAAMFQGWPSQLIPFSKLYFWCTGPPNICTIAIRRKISLLSSPNQKILNTIWPWNNSSCKILTKSSRKCFNISAMPRLNRPETTSLTPFCRR